MKTLEMKTADLQNMTAKQLREKLKDEGFTMVNDDDKGFVTTVAIATGLAGNCVMETKNNSELTIFRQE